MSADEQAIRELVAAWLRESQAGNLSAILQLMAEDAVFLRPGCPALRGRDAFAAKFQRIVPAVVLDVQSEIREVVVSGDLASCWSQLTITLDLPEKRPVRRSGPVLTIFRRSPAGTWELFRDAKMLTAVSTPG